MRERFNQNWMQEWKISYTDRQLDEWCVGTDIRKLVVSGSYLGAHFRSAPASMPVLTEPRVQGRAVPSSRKPTEFLFLVVHQDLLIIAAISVL